MELKYTPFIKNKSDLNYIVRIKNKDFCTLLYHNYFKKTDENMGLFHTLYSHPSITKFSDFDKHLFNGFCSGRSRKQYITDIIDAKGVVSVFSSENINNSTLRAYNTVFLKSQCFILNNHIEALDYIRQNNLTLTPSNDGYTFGHVDESIAVKHFDALKELGLDVELYCTYNYLKDIARSKLNTNRNFEIKISASTKAESACRVCIRSDVDKDYISDMLKFNGCTGIIRSAGYKNYSINIRENLSDTLSLLELYGVDITSITITINLYNDSKLREELL